VDKEVTSIPLGFLVDECGTLGIVCRSVEVLAGLVGSGFPPNRFMLWAAVPDVRLITDEGKVLTNEGVDTSLLASMGICTAASCEIACDVDAVI
jgi:hypothetical protein